MAARTGMATIISELRALIAAGSADYSIAGASYFTDDQLENELDKTQHVRYMAPLEIIPRTVAGGSVQYLDYKLCESGHIEETTAGTSIFVIRDSIGTVLGTANYSFNYDSKMLLLAANSGGSAYYADYRAYNLNRAAANLWKWKAAHVANRVDWQSDNHRVNASQEAKACMEIARQYEKMSGARSVRMVRGDVVSE